MLRLLTVACVVLGVSALLAQQTAAPAALAWPPQGVAVPGNGITPPNLLQRVQPQYPYDAMRRGIQGTVVLGCVVEKDGSVGDVHVLRSLEADLDSLATTAVEQWRFAPARTKDGSPIAVAITLNLSFRIAGSPPPSPTLAWPQEFDASQSDAVKQHWIEKTVDTAGLRIHLSYPNDWFYQEFPPNDSRLATLRGAMSMRAVTIRRPHPVPISLDGPLTTPALDHFVGGIETLELSQKKKIEFRSYGQVMTSSTLWVWMDVHASPSDLPQPPIGRGMFSDIRSWLFVTSVDRQMVMMDCSILVPTDATAEQRKAQLDQATAQFAGIMRALSIGHR